MIALIELFLRGILWSFILPPKQGKNRKGLVRVFSWNEGYFSQIRVCPIDNGKKRSIMIGSFHSGNAGVLPFSLIFIAVTAVQKFSKAAIFRLRSPCHSREGGNLDVQHEHQPSRPPLSRG